MLIFASKNALFTRNYRNFASSKKIAENILLSRTDNQVNKLKRIINWTVWTLMGLYVLVLVGIEVPAVQRFLGNMVAGALKEKLGTTVSVGKINLGLLNRVIIDDILIYDQQKQEMVRANRLSAKV